MPASQRAGTLGLHFDTPEVVYNWLQCTHLCNKFGDRLGRRFENSAFIACFAPVVLLIQLYYFFRTIQDGGLKLLSINTQLALFSFVSVVWLALVLLQLLIGINHNQVRLEFIQDV
jgi:hypothetical protein